METNMIHRRLDEKFVLNLLTVKESFATVNKQYPNHPGISAIQYGSKNNK